MSIEVTSRKISTSRPRFMLLSTYTKRLAVMCSYIFANNYWMYL